MHTHIYTQNDYNVDEAKEEQEEEEKLNIFTCHKLTVQQNIKFQNVYDLKII